jgi:lipopolysaccharide transport system ATP-binding protein
VRALASGGEATLRLRIAVEQALPEITAGIVIRDRMGNDIFGTNTFHCEAPRRDLAAGERLCVDFRFDALRLGSGSFSVTAALHAQDSHVESNYDWWDRALVFEVVPGDGPMGVGVCNFPVQARWSQAGACEVLQ